MVLLIWLFTAVMVVDCAVLVLLVLIQLPKKEAGAGLAFGGGATDALFGAGSGNVLTRITKYAAGAFFILAIVLSMMQSYVHHRARSSFLSEMEKPGHAVAPAAAPATTPAPAAAPAVTPAPTTNSGLLTTPVESTNLTTPAAGKAK